MTGPIVFLDTETTGLHADRRVWEVAMIRREPDGSEKSVLMQVSDVDLTSADPVALRIGRFYERHLGYNLGQTVPKGCTFEEEWHVAREVEYVTRGASLVAANPAFDAGCLAAMLARHRLVPAWHYHLVDVEAVAIGWLAANGRRVDLPARSSDLSRDCGVEPKGFDRHTAMGDAMWVRAWFDVVMSPGRLAGPDIIHTVMKQGAVGPDCRRFVVCTCGRTFTEGAGPGAAASLELQMADHFTYIEGSS